MALLGISLRDFVIVHELQLEFASGFSVLTGETGAGKSILIDALQFALGARADQGVIREGASRGEVSAEFSFPAGSQSWLETAGFDASETLLLRRTIDVQGRSRGWINGSPATAAQLRDLGERLLEIHGQHAWQSLTRPDTVRALLDAYAGVDTQEVARCWHVWRDAARLLIEATTAQSSLQSERERLQWQIGELEKLAPATDEWETLNAEHTRLANAQSIIDAAAKSLELLEGDERGVVASLSQARSLLGSIAGLEPTLSAAAEVLESCQAQAEDTVYTLHAYLRTAGPDPQRLQGLDERLSTWMSLARRFHRPPPDLPALLAAWKTEAARLEASADLVALERAERSAHQDWLAQALRISEIRRKAAAPLAKAVTEAMQLLGMEGGRFVVQLGESAQEGPSGIDEVNFLVAPHRGSTPKPVMKVASGGELSRISLAIAVTTSRLGEAQTLIFDEIDAGVGGAVGQAVGRLMRQLGIDRQVLSVTHLPQVAACAEHHFVVTKQTGDNGPSSTVRHVQDEARTLELARMLGGAEITRTSVEHAVQLLEQGAKSHPAVTA